MYILGGLGSRWKERGVGRLAAGILGVRGYEFDDLMGMARGRLGMLVGLQARRRALYCSRLGVNVSTLCEVAYEAYWSRQAHGTRCEGSFRGIYIYIYIISMKVFAFLARVCPH